MDIIKKEGTSEVHFITNDKLKIFMKEVQTIFKNQLEETHVLREGRYYESILEIQYSIRQHIIQNQHRIDFNNKSFRLIDGDPKSMPSLFGLYMMVVSDVDHIDSILDVMEQVEKNYFVHMGVKHYVGTDASAVLFYETEIHEKKVCCCSHKCSLEHMGVIKNYRTNYHVVIGCDCIKKNQLIDKEVIRSEEEKTEKFIAKKAITVKAKAEKKALSDIVKAEKQELKDNAKLERETNRNAKMEEKRMEQEYKENEKRYKAEIKRIIQEEAEKERLDKIRRKTVYDYRYYIKVNFGDKEKAKEYRARWNPERKQWYIPPKCKNTSILKEKYDK